MHFSQLYHLVLLVWILIHFHKHNFFDVSCSKDEIILGGVRFCYGFLRSRPRVSVYHFVTCNPPILLPDSLFFDEFPFSGTCRTFYHWDNCLTENRVIEWPGDYRLFRLSIRCHLIVEWFSGSVESPSSALILVGWAEYSRLWLRWLPGCQIFRLCSFTYRWPYDRFWTSH